jgi:cardiolipin synthase
MMNLPNAITVLRVLLIPVLAWLLVNENYPGAAVVFALAAASDLVDGILARWLGQMTRFGAILDPLADKFTMLTAVVFLAGQGVLPLWLAAAIVLRDVVIVTGATAYHFLLGKVEMAPTLLSKANTVLEFFAIVLTLAHAARWVDAGTVLPALYVATLATVMVTGLHYVVVWGLKAARTRRVPRP